MGTAQFPGPDSGPKFLLFLLPSEAETCLLTYFTGTPKGPNPWLNLQCFMIVSG